MKNKKDKNLMASKPMLGAVTQLEQFEFSKIKGIVGKVAQFFVVGQYKDRSTGENAKCQIKGCDEDACWLIEIKGRGRVFCFSHGEDL